MAPYSPTQHRNLAAKGSDGNHASINASHAIPGAAKREPRLSWAFRHALAMLAEGRA
jgi:hypothetical protein